MFSKYTCNICFIHFYQDVDLKSLPSYIFYDNLDRGLQNYNDEDKNFWEFIGTSDIKNTGIADKLLKGFYYVYYMHGDKYLYEERWNYLYYWTGEKVINRLTDSITFEKVMYPLKSIRNKFNSKDPYKEHIFSITKDQFEKLKKIYDYFENYNSIFQKIGYRKSDCTAELKKHVEDSFQIYKTLKHECAVKKTEHYCKMFQELVKKYQKDDLNELTCNGTKDPTISAEDESVHYTEVQSLRTGSQEAQLQSGLEGETQDRSMHGGHIQSY